VRLVAMRTELDRKEEQPDCVEHSNLDCRLKNLTQVVVDLAERTARAEQASEGFASSESGKDAASEILRNKICDVDMSRRSSSALSSVLDDQESSVEEQEGNHRAYQADTSSEWRNEHMRVVADLAERMARIEDERERVTPASADDLRVLQNEVSLIAARVGDKGHTALLIKLRNEIISMRKKSEAANGDLDKLNADLLALGEQIRAERSQGPRAAEDDRKSNAAALSSLHKQVLELASQVGRCDAAVLALRHCVDGVGNDYEKTKSSIRKVCASTDSAVTRLSQTTAELAERTAHCESGIAGFPGELSQKVDHIASRTSQIQDALSVLSNIVHAQSAAGSSARPVDGISGAKRTEWEVLTDLEDHCTFLEEVHSRLCHTVSMG